LFIRRDTNRVVAGAVTGGRHGKDSAAEIAAATTVLPVGKSQALWQRGFFDHLIRNTESYVQKWIMFERILFVLGWLGDARIGRFKVKLWRLTTPKGSAASDGGSYNACGGCITLVEG
jgi:hypothetical protein